MISFADLQREYQLAHSEAYHYLQISHALHKAIPKGEDLPKYSPLEDRLLDDYMRRKAISLNYR